MQHKGTWVLRGVFVKSKGHCGLGLMSYYEDVYENQKLIEWLLSEPNY